MKNYLGGLQTIPQWFVWRMTWDAEESKFAKVPQRWDGLEYPMDSALPANWRTYDEAITYWGQCNAHHDGHRYALGFRLTADTGYWFLDLDKAVTESQWSPLAQRCMAMFPGAFMEVSSSGNGLHIIGRGVVPEHIKRRDDLHIEFYTDKRGIAFGSQQTGHADTDHSANVAALVAEFFPPPLAGAAHSGEGPRADWSGPDDDDALIQLALASRSVAHRFGAGSTATFAELWKGDRADLARYWGDQAHHSEPDGALSKHLAFWTGCDLDRMMRLMWRSGLVREKWYKHRKYVQITCESAIKGQRDVYKQAERVDVQAEMYALPALAIPGVTPANPPAPVTVTELSVPDEVFELQERALDLVSQCGSDKEMHAVVIPAVRAMQLPEAMVHRVASLINKQLSLWDGKMPISEVRRLINPPKIRRTDTDIPEWVHRHVFVKTGDKFYDIVAGTFATKTGFNAQFNRNMPERADGSREDAAQMCLDNWGMTTVDGVMYAPGDELIFEWHGRVYVNTFSEKRVQRVADAYTQVGIDGINRFLSHLRELCNRRDDLFRTLVDWIAHNVQFPGRKIKFVPIIKGCQGDGKSLIGRVLKAAMGGPNVKAIGPTLVANTGGFTDWAHGQAVTLLEEIYLIGTDRYRVSNMVKEFITEDEITINGKGDKPHVVRNMNNYIAVTNHSDAIPLSDDDRRWWVIFTPFYDKELMRQHLGTDDLIKYFEPIYEACRSCKGEIRKFFLEYQISPEFVAHGYAPHTAEKSQMRDSGVDEADLLAKGIIEDGCYGVTPTVLSSECLSRQMSTLRMVEGVTVPKAAALNHLLSRLGYSVVGRIKWDGAPRRVWVKPGVNPDPAQLRAILDTTKKSQP